MKMYRRPSLAFGLAVCLLVGTAARAKRIVSQSEPWGSGEDAATEAFLLGAEIVERHELDSGVTLPIKLTLRVANGRRTACGKTSSASSRAATRPRRG